MFFVAPLFFIALCWWIDRGLPRPRAAARLHARRGRARRRRPVQRADQRQRHVGHARAASRCGRCRTRSSRSTRSPPSSSAGAILIAALVLTVPVRWALALPAARARALRRRAVGDRGQPARRHPPCVGRRALRRHLEAARATGSTRASAGTPRRRPLRLARDGQVHRLEERVLQPLAARRLRPRRADARRAAGDAGAR